MKINKLELKIKYQDELDTINSICLSVPNYVFTHTKSDLTIEFLQNNNIKFPKISQTILFYLLYNERKTEYKYIINYFFNHLNFNVYDNLLFIFQFFTNRYALDLTEDEKIKVNNRIETYIIKYFSFLLEKINNISMITYIFDLFFNIFQRNNKLSIKIFFNIIFKYFNKWIKINTAEGIYLDTFDCMVYQIKFYICKLTFDEFLYNKFQKCWRNKRKLIQFAKKYYKY